jgi:hypothetical protein
MTVTVELKRLHSPEVSDLKSFYPTNGGPFGLLVQAMFGPAGIEGEESFDIVVCNPEWLARNLKGNGLYSGRHHLICAEFNYHELINYLRECARNATGANWAEAASKLARVGQWEFEDYAPK